MKRARGDVDGFGGKLRSGMGNLAKWGAAATAAGVAAGVAFGVKAVMAASDMEEALNKVNVVFGTSSREIDQWASTTASSMGISRTEALNTAGAFGNMFDQLGIGPQVSAKMSKEMVGLAADFASFNNLPTAQVLDAMNASFRGEFDALQRVVPTINAAAVATKALAMTGKTNADSLTLQDKALATHALIVEGAGEAEGDFARTSGGLANQMRILKAQASDFAARVGTVLLPIVLKGLELFKKLAGHLKTVLTPVFETIRGGILAFGAAFKAADGDVTSSGFPGFMERVANFLTGTLIPAFQTVIGWIQNFAGTFRSQGDDAKTTAGKLMGIINQVKGVFSSAFGAISAQVEVAVNFIKGVWRVFGDDLMSFARESWAAITEVIRGALNVITGIFDLIKAILTGKWGDAWTAIKKIVDGAWDAIFGAVRNAVTNVIPTMLAGLGQAVVSIGRTVWNGISEPLGGILGWIRDRFGDLVGFIGGLPGRIGHAAGDMFRGVQNAFRGALNWIIDKWNGLRFELPQVNFGPFKSPGFTLDLPNIPRFHQGGVVPGSPGTEVPAILQAGERVLPAGGGGGVVVNVNVAGSIVGSDPRAVAAWLHELLLQRKRTNGDLGL